MSTSVLIADDHVVVRRGVRALLENEPDIVVVGEAGDGLEAVEQVMHLLPDVLVLDLVMPDISGLGVLKQLRDRHVPTRVVVLSMHAGDVYVAHALRCGAVAYVVKDASASELIQAVRCAARNQRFLSAPLSEEAIEACLDELASTPDTYELLTSREREVFGLAADGMTNGDIGVRLGISGRTAESHRANILRKLGLKGQQELTRYAARRGPLEL
jgi:two-component system response regulator NreC